MRIGIDIRTINKPKSGVGYYVTNLIHEFQRIDRENEYCLISNKRAYDSEFGDVSNFHNCRTIVSNENHIVGDLWEHFMLPGFLRKRGVELFHGPAFMIPLRPGSLRTLVTIHDIVAFVKPDTVPLKYALYMQWLIKRVVRIADKIITDSVSTKNDIVNRLGVPEDKIDVIHLAVASTFTPAGPNGNHELVKRKFGIRDRYILFTGNLEPRKNLVRLMQAFDMAAPKLGDSYQLVICGKKGWLYRNILNEYRRLKKNGNIILTDYVGDNDLLRLYQAADMFAFPTLYEGFGLPPLEAMSCGVPVIASNVSSLPEIVGDAAVLVDPLDVGEISEAMADMARSNGLRDELKKKGLKQAGRFSWKRTAEHTLDVYRSVL